MAKDTLRKCPVCMTKVTDEIVKLMGVRHYQKIDSLLPGKVRGMDIDYVLDQNKTGRFLVLEFKPSKARMSFGQRTAFDFFKRNGADVWVINDGHFQKDGTVDVGIMDRDGYVRRWFDGLDEEALGKKLEAWWNWGLRGS